MSNAIFPSLPGLAWGIQKSPKWATMVSESASGRQYALSKRLYPLWHFKLPFEFLRAGSPADLQTLVGFINARRGRYDDFLYLDPRDNAVSAQAFGTGDGTTTAFQLVRSLGGFSEPVYDVNGTPSIFKNANDWRGNEQQYTTARTNLFSYSQQFDNAYWLKGRSSITADATTAPDGTTTADKLVEDTTASNNHYVGKTSGLGLVAGTTYAFSVYAKAGERTQAFITLFGLASAECYFDLNAGTITQKNAAVAGASITAVGGGWYRLVVTWNYTGTGSGFIVGPTVAGNSIYTGDGASGIYLWGAQLETAAATPYIPTTSAAVTKTDCTLASGLVTFATAPQAAAALTWSGSFYFRCRFLQDEIAFEQFLQDLWTAKSVEFQTFRP